MYRAVCRRECQWRGALWRVGSVYEGDERPPRYFLMERGEGTEAVPEAEPPKKTTRRTTK